MKKFWPRTFLNSFLVNNTVIALATLREVTSKSVRKPMESKSSRKIEKGRENTRQQHLPDTKMNRTYKERHLIAEEWKRYLMIEFLTYSLEKIFSITFTLYCIRHDRRPRTHDEHERRRRRE